MDGRFLTRQVDDEITVLHVDDEPDFARMVGTHLARIDDRITVHSTTQPESVTSRLESEPIDCILTDYWMPEQTGLDVLSQARESDPDMPVILLTDTGSEAIASKAISAGISDYVIKRELSAQYQLLANKISTHVERRRAQAVATRTHQQLYELAENTRDALWIFSADWSELQFINSQYERIFDQSIETLSANPTDFLETIHPADVTDVTDAMKRASDGHSQHVEYRIEAETTKWVESYAEPITTDAGDVVRIAGFTHDITARKASLFALRDKNEQLERFASIVSHDLRNPLSVAEGYLDLARETVDSDHLETVDRALLRMRNLIGDLLMLAREGQEIRDTESVSVDTLVRSSWNNIDQKQASLQTETKAVIPADEVRLGQVFENLFRNAIEHGGSSVQIRVGVLESESGLYIENDGEPIPATHREDIFETGFTTNTGGTGFGLAIVQRIVDAHGWTLRLAETPTDTVRFEITGIDSLTKP